MTDNETIADIIAEMRGMGNYQRYSGDHARVLADRLEAAHRRERGDCAKLREALKAIGGLCTGLMPTWDGAIGRIKDIAEAALSAPPRNCDRFATVDEARKAHEEYRGDYIMRASNIFDFPMEFEAWLFAPATEKEGGAK
jgi:hypothetical protein